MHGYGLPEAGLQVWGCEPTDFVGEGIFVGQNSQQ